MPEKRDIRTLKPDELGAWLAAKKEKAFRARQIHEWIWQKGASSFSEMSNLSKGLRANLEAEFVINALHIDLQQKSSDETIKVRFSTWEGHKVEGVLIPTPNRVTACISSQVGCSLSCSFCATGKLKRVRNLDRGEIFDQVLLLNRLAEKEYGRRLSNIVFMGMGEPLLNYRNVMAGIDRISSEDGLGISPRRITVSTAGIAKMIRQLGDDGVKFNLALSLHATTDEQRSKIMPINEQNKLKTLVDALNYFYSKTRGRITFEYILFDGYNESPEDAKRLVALCRQVPAKVNIIEYNPIEGVNFEKARSEKREEFIQYLENHGATATFRRSRGRDIDAACGQLANK